MRVDEFDFDLPEERIALRPAVPRDAARLLVVRPRGMTGSSTSPLRGGRKPGERSEPGFREGGETSESHPPSRSSQSASRPANFDLPSRGRLTGADSSAVPTLEDRAVRDLPRLLKPGDTLVFNDTKVIPAQLYGVRTRGDFTLGMSVTLLERIDDSSWWALAKPGRRLKLGDRIRFGHEGRVCLLGTLEATVEEKLPDGRVRLAFGLHGAYLDEAVAALGDAPLPPYILQRRPPDERDRADYQTVYARQEGAVAAPTAGLHFTQDLLKALDEAGIVREFVTLHVGPGTFLPVKAEDTEHHQMHAERGSVSAETAERLNAARVAGGRIVAVGTTSLRLLEAAADATGKIGAFDGATDIFITPGYRFRAVDLLLTNFHLPRSTLFILVSAFSGLATTKAAYAHAIEKGYRFYSYGDACLLYPVRGD